MDFDKLPTDAKRDNTQHMTKPYEEDKYSF
jgi:hypothetical protein